MHPDLWQDRIRKAKLMGLNTIETYVAWNAHAPSPGAFSFDGGLDLGRFLDLVAEEGMHAIVRPGPYICAEWSNGGLPYWLFADGTVGVRRDEPGFLAAVRDYLEQLAPVLVPRQIDQGGRSCSCRSRTSTAPTVRTRPTCGSSSRCTATSG